MGVHCTIEQILVRGRPRVLDPLQGCRVYDHFQLHSKELQRYRESEAREEIQQRQEMKMKKEISF